MIKIVLASVCLSVLLFSSGWADSDLERSKSNSSSVACSKAESRGIFDFISQILNVIRSYIRFTNIRMEKGIQDEELNDLLEEMDRLLLKIEMKNLK